MVESGLVSWVEQIAVRGWKWFSVLGRKEGSPWRKVVQCLG